MAQYTYDEQGYNFYYFLISVLSLCLIPVTVHSIYSFAKSNSKNTYKPPDITSSTTSVLIAFIIRY